MVTDREYITREIAGRGERPAYGWVPPAVPQYTSQEFTWAKLPKKQRLVVARQLYAEAGYGPGKQLKVELRPGDSENRVKIAQRNCAPMEGGLGSGGTEVAIGSDEKAPEDPSMGVLTAEGLDS